MSPSFPKQLQGRSNSLGNNQDSTTAGASTLIRRGSSRGSLVGDAVNTGETDKGEKASDVTSRKESDIDNKKMTVESGTPYIYIGSTHNGDHIPAHTAKEAVEAKTERQQEALVKEKPVATTSSMNEEEKVSMKNRKKKKKQDGSMYAGLLISGPWGYRLYKEGDGDDDEDGDEDEGDGDDDGSDMDGAGELPEDYFVEGQKASKSTLGHTASGSGADIPKSSRERKDGEGTRGNDTGAAVTGGENVVGRKRGQGLRDSVVSISREAIEEVNQMVNQGKGKESSRKEASGLNGTNITTTSDKQTGQSGGTNGTVYVASSSSSPSPSSLDTSSHQTSHPANPSLGPNSSFHPNPPSLPAASSPTRSTRSSTNSTSTFPPSTSFSTSSTYSHSETTTFPQLRASLYGNPDYQEIYSPAADVSKYTVANRYVEQTTATPAMYATVRRPLTLGTGYKESTSRRTSQGKSINTNENVIGLDRQISEDGVGGKESGNGLSGSGSPGRVDVSVYLRATESGASVPPSSYAGATGLLDLFMKPGEDEEAQDSSLRGRDQSVQSLDSYRLADCHDPTNHHHNNSSSALPHDKTRDRPQAGSTKGISCADDGGEVTVSIASLSWHQPKGLIDQCSADVLPGTRASTNPNARSTYRASVSFAVLRAGSMPPGELDPESLLSDDQHSDSSSNAEASCSPTMRHMEDYDADDPILNPGAQ